MNTSHNERFLRSPEGVHLREVLLYVDEEKEQDGWRDTWDKDKLV